MQRSTKNQEDHSSECGEKYAQNVFYRADIVRDVRVALPASTARVLARPNLRRIEDRDVISHEQQLGDRMCAQSFDDYSPTQPLLPGENAAVEVEGDLLGVEGCNAEITCDAVEKRGIWRADNINLAVQIPGTDAESRHQDELRFDAATDATAGDGRLPLVRGRFELWFVKHGAAHACVGDHPKFAAIKINGHGQA